MSPRSVRRAPFELNSGIISDDRAHLAQSVRDLFFLADITRVERNVMVALDNVENGHGVAPSEKGLHNMPSKKTAATDDEIDVF